MRERDLYIGDLGVIPGFWNLRLERIGGQRRRGAKCGDQPRAAVAICMRPVWPEKVPAGARLTAN